MENVDRELAAYVEREIIPRYREFDAAHREDHVRTVIRESLHLAAPYGLDPNLIYAAAAWHDTGLVAGRERHHLVSGRSWRQTGGCGSGLRRSRSGRFAKRSRTIGRRPAEAALPVRTDRGRGGPGDRSRRNPAPHGLLRAGPLSRTGPGGAVRPFSRPSSAQVCSPEAI